MKLLRPQKRDCIAPLAEQSTGDGADDETKAESGADHTETFGAAFLIGHIGDVGLCNASSPPVRPYSKMRLAKGNP